MHTIDPEFRSSKYEDGLDFVKFLAYVNELKPQIPEMVRQATRGGTLDEEVFESLFLPIKCNLGQTLLATQTAFHLLRELTGIDMQKWIDLANQLHPRGEVLALVAAATHRREEAEGLADKYETRGDALTAARENNRTMGLLAERISADGSAPKGKEGFDPESVVVDPVGDVLLRRLGDELRFMTVTARLGKCPDEDYFVDVIARDLTGEGKPYSYDEIRSKRHFKYLTHYLPEECHWTEDSVRRKLVARLSDLKPRKKQG